MKLPNSEVSVKSSMVGLKPFEYQSSKTEAEFFDNLNSRQNLTMLQTLKTLLLRPRSIMYKTKDGRLMMLSILDN